MKRAFDITASFLGLLIIWPVLLVIAALIAVKMGRPVIFRQQRVGRGGRTFTMYKFRTMSIGHNGSSVTVGGEARITPLGAKLRRLKLDELPELWNILLGDMSFVGPRPDVPGYADRLTGDDRVILTLRPGLTGPATLKYRNEEELLAAQDDPIGYNDNVVWPDKVHINREYALRHTLWGDIKIIFETFFGKGNDDGK